MIRFQTRKTQGATRATGGTASASVAIGTATCFVLATAGVSLLVDRGAGPAPAAADWTLRGAIAPADAPAPGPAKRVAAPSVRRWA